MTLKEKFIKEHPKAPLSEYGRIPMTCPYRLGYTPENEKGLFDCRSNTCRDCWNREYKEW